MSNPITPAHLESDQFSLKTALLSVAVIALVVSGLIYVALYFNQLRRDKVITQYETETNQLIANHKTEAKKFFTETFDQCQHELTELRSQPGGNQQTLEFSCTEPAQTGLTQMGAQTLRDSSAATYIRYDHTNYKYEMIDASGTYIGSQNIHDGGSYRLSYEPTIKADLINYLDHDQPINHWQDFISYLPGKEVLIPVVIDNQTVGYIFRGVIER